MAKMSRQFIILQNQFCSEANLLPIGSFIAVKFSKLKRNFVFTRFRYQYKKTTIYLQQYVGTINLSLTYFPPEAARQKTFPSKGT